MLIPCRGNRGFTIVEMLVSLAILTLLMLLLITMTNFTSKTWTYTTAKIEEFRSARDAFETMTRKISQATLNSYYEYDNPNAPTKYLRQSELRFISGPAASLSLAAQDGNVVTHAIFFQAALGSTGQTSYSSLNTLLNTAGYFIEFNSDASSRPGFLSQVQNAPAPRYRFRLMEMIEPSESLSLYKYTNGKYNNAANGSPVYNQQKWYTDLFGETPVPERVIAENIVALIILPKLSPSDQAIGNYHDWSLVGGSSGSLPFVYDTTFINSDANLDPSNQLPPVLQVTMVAVDETSFNRYMLKQGGTSLPTTLYNNGGSQLFTVPQSYSTDLATFEGNLQKASLNYRVFTTDISLKSAKWSRFQQN